MEILVYLIVFNLLAIDFGLIFYFVSINNYRKKINNIDLSKIDLGGN